MNDSKRISWKRLFAEGTAIVASILLAFAIDAWWQDRSDQVRIKEFLSQIRADTLDNQRRLTEALQLETVQLVAIRQILAALRIPEPISPDSARSWTQVEPGFIWYSDPRLLDGTISALISTGDINLVQNQEVQTALIRYLGQLQADMNEFDRGVDQFLLHEAELLRLFELSRTTGVDPGEDGFANELLSVQHNKAAAAVFRLLAKNIENRAWYLEQMLAATEDLNGLLASRNAR